MSNTNSITFENSLAESSAYKDEKTEEIKICIENKQLQIKIGDSFEQVVAVIEEKYGKRLTEKGLEKILKQIEKVLVKDEEKENKRK